MITKSAAFFCLLSVPGFAGTVGWYNGDFDGVNGLANVSSSTIVQANTYDDFVVSSNWTVVGVFSNDLMNFTGITQANWEIRSGVSVENSGVLVAGGTSAATQTATGRSGFGYNEYTIEVDGLNVALAPGTYWLTVAPITQGDGNSYLSTTSGANAVGTPPGNNDNSFFSSTDFGANFDAASNQVASSPADFSEGVLIGSALDASAVPEPGTLGAGIGAILLLAGLRRRRAN